MSNNPFAIASRFAKTAAIGAPPPSLDDINFNSGMKDVGQMGLAALGVGAGLRGLVGLYNLIHHNVSPPKNRYPGALVTRVPIPVSEDENEPRRRKTALDKTAWGGVADYHNDIRYMPAMIGAGALGLYGGYKGIDAILQKRRQSANEEDINNARSDFEKALLESYPKPRKPSGMQLDPTSKLAADDGDAEKLSAALDNLYDRTLEKKAFMGISQEDAQRWGGMYLGAYALPSALLAGKAVYDRSMKTNDSAILQKAIAKRQRRAYQSRPSEILAVPNEVNVPRDEFNPGGAADEDAERDSDPSEPTFNPGGSASNRKIIRGIL